MGKKIMMKNRIQNTYPFMKIMLDQHSGKWRSKEYALMVPGYVFD
jgi:hypothetical protein